MAAMSVAERDAMRTKEHEIMRAKVRDVLAKLRRRRCTNFVVPNQHPFRIMFERTRAKGE